ncbi:hypothetical protein [Rugamonas sp.]|uniref:hypothetical protein n=1 Tax=Rugamonas sp. TaxID=1926287 RepID=UPI0025F81F2E|nr:hypothetical protein [Rugamonas sp.]
MKNNQDDPRSAKNGGDPGFKVPAPSADAKADANADANTMRAANAAAAQASAPAGASSVPADAGSAAGIEVAPVEGAPATDTSARDQLLGGGIFVVLLIIFFFARNAYTHHLVRRRVAPSAAGTAGWLLLVGLGFLSGAAVLAIMNSAKFLSVAVMVPLLVFGVLALIAALLTGRR